MKGSVISVVHASADLKPSSGGVPRVVVELADALAESGRCQVQVVSQSPPGERLLPQRSRRVQRQTPSAPGGVSFRCGVPFKRAMSKLASTGQIDLIHNHGLWLPVNYWAARSAFEYRLRLVTQPHGMLEPWALAYKATRKWFALKAFERYHLERADALIATSEAEQLNFRRLGFKNPIAVIPNGASLNAPDRTFSIEPPTPRRLLFMSRIHPKKGLSNLMEAWNQVRPAGWILRIAGPDEGGHLSAVMNHANQLNLMDRVEYVGEIADDNKSRLFNEADVFVLPSFSENFGIVVAEALAHGLPVVTTRGAPWGDLEEFGCGWWVDIGPDPLAAALRKATSLTPEARAEMGLRGRAYVQRFDWSRIADLTATVYEWVCHGGTTPPCVATD